ncbi:MAG: family 43 glycosylhydrolase [Clostridia bacterium]|nr:family 43 glycosylhydrolase [Clostridia bacterium]
MNTFIKNGEKMCDIEGKPICVQFPHIIFHNNKYYLYGSNKEFSNGKTGFWHWGIKMYESTDLYNWKDLGLIIPPDTDDENSPLNPRNMMDAPRIIYNKNTKKWVCWIINMNVAAYSFVSDSLLGPYEMVGEGFKPFGMGVGDFDLACDDQGQGYVFFNRPHTEIVCGRLTDDYTRVTGEPKSFFKHPESVPFNREAPTYLRISQKHYLITSGTTTFYPNPSQVAVSDSICGPFEGALNPHVDDDSNTSFHSQIRSVFKVPNKKDLYIALADRWLPDFMNIPYEKCEEWHLALYNNSTDEDKERALKEEREYTGTNDLFSLDISKAQYVILPIVFEGDIPRIYWRDSWSLDEFE